MCCTQPLLPIMVRDDQKNMVKNLNSMTPLLGGKRELWLARDLVAQHHLPWQKPLDNLTPGRVAQSFASLLMEIGTPAVSPKPRGKSPGWTLGNKRTKKIRYPVVKKGKTSHKKSRKKAS